MNSTEEIILYRFVTDECGFFRLIFFEHKIQSPALYYYPKQDEKPLLFCEGLLNLRICYSGLLKLEKVLQEEETFHQTLQTLKDEEKSRMKNLSEKIPFRHSEEHFLFKELLFLFREAEKAGMFQENFLIHSIHNPKAWSTWQIHDVNPWSAEGFYCLSGIAESPEYMDMTFIQLPYSRNRLFIHPELMLESETKDALLHLNKYCHCWDNPAFLLYVLLPLLKKASPYFSQLVRRKGEGLNFPDIFWNSISENDQTQAKKILNSIPADDWEMVWKLFEKAQKNGLLDLYKNKDVPEVLELILKIHQFYQINTPEYYHGSMINKATEEEIGLLEEKLGEELPKTYKAFLMNNDLAFSFDGNFKSLAIKEVIRNWERMNTLLDNGAFEDGRIEKHLKEGFGNWKGNLIKQVWWSKKWLPIAEDSAGNKKCIDFDPGNRGNKGQMISMEVQDGQGPFLYTKADDFKIYLENHLSYLNKRQFRWTEYGGGGRMIEVDSYLKPE